MRVASAIIVVSSTRDDPQVAMTAVFVAARNEGRKAHLCENVR